MLTVYVNLKDNTQEKFLTNNVTVLPNGTLVISQLTGYVAFSEREWINAITIEKEPNVTPRHDIFIDSEYVESVTNVNLMDCGVVKGTVETKQEIEGVTIRNLHELYFFNPRFFQRVTVVDRT